MRGTPTLYARSHQDLINELNARVEALEDAAPPVINAAILESVTKLMDNLKQYLAAFATLPVAGRSKIRHTITGAPLVWDDDYQGRLEAEIADITRLLNQLQA